jgi:Na+-transporting methylmalonyl-CoA/oxaloacetate decarboxylase beta subunit
LFGLLESGMSSFSWGNALMIAIGLGLIFLAIAKKMEPLLLIPIGFGMMLVNLPLGGIMDYELDLRTTKAGNVLGVSVEEGDRVKGGDTICM